MEITSTLLQTISTNNSTISDKQQEVYSYAYEAGKKAGQESATGIDISDRTNLAMWYQPYAYPLVHSYYYDSEDYNQEWPINGRPSEAGVPVIESLPFPTGTQNITDFSLFTRVLVYEWDDAQWGAALIYTPIWVKRFTGTLDVSGTTSLENLFYGIAELEECPSLSNTSHIDKFGGIFSNCRNLLSVPTLDLSSASGITSMFSGCSSLHTIENLILPRNDKFRSWVYTFSNCSSLVNLTLTGTNSVTGLDLGKSTKLSKASITSVINAFKKPNLRELDSTLANEEGYINYYFTPENSSTEYGLFVKLDENLDPSNYQIEIGGVYCYYQTWEEEDENGDIITNGTEYSEPYHTYLPFTINGEYIRTSAFKNLSDDEVYYDNMDIRVVDNDGNTVDSSNYKVYLATLTGTTISATLSKTAVDVAFETSPGAKNGSRSTEWAELIETRPEVTISLV